MNPIAHLCSTGVTFESIASIPYAKPIDGPINVLLVLGAALSFLRPTNSPLTDSLHSRNLIGLALLSALGPIVGAVSFHATYWGTATVLFISIIVLRWKSERYSVAAGLWWTVFGMFLLLDLWLWTALVHGTRLH